MSKKAWIISYIFVMLTALCFISIFEYFEWSKFFLIVLACFFLCYPIIISKRAKEATHTREQDFMYTHILVFLVSVLMCSLFFHIMPEKDYLIAVTKNLEKANQIQNFLTTKTRPTGRCLVLNNNNNTFEYGITIREQLGKKDSLQLQADLLDSSIMDDSIKIVPNIQWTKNRKKLLERLERELRWIILYINGVESASVSIYLNDKDINSSDSKLKKVYVNIKTKQCADYKKIHTQIYMLIRPLFENQSSTEIEIYNSTLFHEARQEYKNKNYFKAWELLEILETFDYDYNNRHNDVVSLIKFIDIDDKIKKEPNNYKLYIERGNLKNVPLWSMFNSDSTFLSDIEGAIGDYNKALELNPKAYEVYEKRGDAWASVNHNSEELDIRQIRYPEDDQHAIEDYKKAIELTGGNDELYEKLGDMYTNPKMKLKYYNQIKNLYPERLPVPYKVNLLDFGFDTGPFFYLPLKIARCYAQLNEYDEAIKILENAKKYKEHYTVANLIFLYNWKAGHYMTALKNADSCSVWVCKALGVFF